MRHKKTPNISLNVGNRIVSVNPTEMYSACLAIDKVIPDDFVMPNSNLGKAYQLCKDVIRKAKILPACHGLQEDCEKECAECENYY